MKNISLIELNEIEKTHIETKFAENLPLEVGLKVNKFFFAHIVLFCTAYYDYSSSA